MKTGSATLGIVGGAIAPRSGLLGGVLLLASAVGILLVLEIGFISLITAIPIGLGGTLALAGSATGEHASTS